jgi:hypothetical protein
MIYCLGNSSQYPLGWRLGGSKSRSGRGSEQKTIRAVAGNRTPVVTNYII